MNSGTSLGLFKYLNNKSIITICFEIYLWAS